MMGLELVTSGSAILAAVPICVAAPWIMRAYGRGFAAGSKVLIVVAASTVLTAMSITVGHAIWSLNAPVAGVVFALLRGSFLVGERVCLGEIRRTWLSRGQPDNNGDTDRGSNTVYETLDPETGVGAAQYPSSAGHMSHGTPSLLIWELMKLVRFGSFSSLRLEFFS